MSDCNDSAVRAVGVIVAVAALTALAGCSNSSVAAHPSPLTRTVRDAVTQSIVIESARPAHPTNLIVAIHGHNGHAASEYRSWQRYALGHHLGLVSVEWQTQWGRDAQFLTTDQTYAMIRRAVRQEGVAAGHVLLHGFSQGSHESFDLTALDRAGPHLFAMTLAESGGDRGATGPLPGFAGTRWDIYCAGRDPWPHLTGCPAMRNASALLTRSGARVTRFMVDPPAHHGGFLKNRRDVDLVLGDFARAVRGR